jgi:hypothetical protein
MGPLQLGNDDDGLMRQGFSTEPDQLCRRENHRVRVRVRLDVHDARRVKGSELASFSGSVREWLAGKSAVWSLVGRVHFHLAENKSDPDRPFAFLATYTSRVSAHGKAQHLPLSQALAEFSDGKSQARLLSLLMPVQRAAEQCGWLRAMVESGAISGKMLKDLYDLAFERGKDFPAVYEEQGRPQQSSDTSALEKMIDEVIAGNPKQVEQYRAGKTTLMGFFVGQVMKASKGQANQGIVNELFAKKLA